MKSKLTSIVVVLVTLALTSVVAARVIAPTWTRLRAREPALQLESTSVAAGQGVTLALLGGFRALVADAMWLRLYVNWEKRNLAATDAFIHLVPRIDPRPEYFWLNGARMIAYDFPVWRIEAAGGYDVASATQQERIGREQAQAGIAHLEAAIAFHPQSADLWIERANIELNHLHDLTAAAESYRRAWEQPHAPYYAARLHAEMLRRLGRKNEALAWLVKLYPMLPRDSEAAGADAVLARIHALEQELGVPPERTYRPPP